MKNPLRVSNGAQITMERMKTLPMIFQRGERHSKGSGISADLCEGNVGRSGDETGDEPMLMVDWCLSECIRKTEFSDDSTNVLDGTESFSNNGDERATYCDVSAELVVESMNEVSKRCQISRMKWS